MSPFGDVARGHDQIARELSRVLGGIALGTTHVTSVLRVEFVTDDVAVLDGEAVIERAEPADDDRLVHRYTDVFVRSGATWSIAHIRANMLRAE